MAIIKAYRICEVKYQDRDAKEIKLIPQNQFPEYRKYSDAAAWIRKPENYQKEWTIVEVFVDDKYL